MQVRTFLFSSLVATTLLIAAKAASSSNPVLYTWNDNVGKGVTLRSTINTKIQVKHNLTYRVARTVTQHPEYRWREPSSATVFNYELRALKYECTGSLWWRKCEQVDSMWMRAIVDFRTTTDDKRPFGIVTTYC